MRGLLGRGAMGAVERVWDAALGCEVARKRLGASRPDRLFRFKDEFRLVLGLEHPALVRLHELGEDDDGLFFTMEIVEGVDLARHCAGPERASRARDALSQLANVVGYLHAHGIVHRDLKPANVLVTRDGSLKLLDFGVSARFDEAGLRRSGFVGTPGYMAPEQIRGEVCTPAADVYALGVMLHELYSDRRLFPGERADQAGEHTRATPPRLRAWAPDAPQSLDDLCSRMLADLPSRRPGVADVTAALGGAETATPPRVTRGVDRLVGRSATLAQLEALLAARLTPRALVACRPAERLQHPGRRGDRHRSRVLVRCH